MIHIEFIETEANDENSVNDLAQQPKLQSDPLEVDLPACRSRAVRSKTATSLDDFFAAIETEHDLSIVPIPGKGRGVVTNRSFVKGEWVVEYKGLMVTQKQAKANETRYSRDPLLGSFMFYFRANEKPMCIDATIETNYKGRMLNHSSKKANLQPKVVYYHGTPRVVFLAKRDILLGEELLYDYGDRSPQTIEENPWLKT